MRMLLYLVAALMVMGLAFWAYRENYRTQAQIDQMQAIQNEIAGLRENLGVLRAEWAYLNRPDRLRELVDMNFDRLRLAPVQSNQFGGPRNVDYPAPGAIIPPDGALTQDGGPDGADAAQSPAAPSNNAGAPRPRPSRRTGGSQPDGAAGESGAPVSSDTPAPDTRAPETPAPDAPAARPAPATEIQE